MQSVWAVEKKQRDDARSARQSRVMDAARPSRQHARAEMVVNYHARLHQFMRDQLDASHAAVTAAAAAATTTTTAATAATAANGQRTALALTIPPLRVDRATVRPVSPGAVFRPPRDRDSERAHPRISAARYQTEPQRALARLYEQSVTNRELGVAASVPFHPPPPPPPPATTGNGAQATAPVVAAALGAPAQTARGTGSARSGRPPTSSGPDPHPHNHTFRGLPGGGRDRTRELDPARPWRAGGAGAHELIARTARQFSLSARPPGVTDSDEDGYDDDDSDSDNADAERALFAADAIKTRPGFGGRVASDPDGDSKQQSVSPVVARLTARRKRRSNNRAFATPDPLRAPFIRDAQPHKWLGRASFTRSFVPATRTSDPPFAPALPTVHGPHRAPVRAIVRDDDGGHHRPMTTAATAGAPPQPLFGAAVTTARRLPSPPGKVRGSAPDTTLLSFDASLRTRAAAGTNGTGAGMGAGVELQTLLLQPDGGAPGGPKSYWKAVDFLAHAHTGAATSAVAAAAREQHARVAAAAAAERAVAHERALQQEAVFGALLSPTTAHAAAQAAADLVDRPVPGPDAAAGSAHGSVVTPLVPVDAARTAHHLMQFTVAPYVPGTSHGYVRGTGVRAPRSAAAASAALALGHSLRNGSSSSRDGSSSSRVGTARSAPRTAPARDDALSATAGAGATTVTFAEPPAQPAGAAPSAAAMAAAAEAERHLISSVVLAPPPPPRKSAAAPAPVASAAAATAAAAHPSALKPPRTPRSVSGDVAIAHPQQQQTAAAAGAAGVGPAIIITPPPVPVLATAGPVAPPAAAAAKAPLQLRPLRYESQLSAGKSQTAGAAASARF